MGRSQAGTSERWSVIDPEKRQASSKKTSDKVRYLVDRSVEPIGKNVSTHQGWSGNNIVDDDDGGTNGTYGSDGVRPARVERRQLVSSSVMYKLYFSDTSATRLLVADNLSQCGASAAREEQSARSALWQAVVDAVGEV